MLARISLIAAFIAVSAIPAMSADFPTRKAGLWNVTMNFGDKRLPPQNTKFCVDNNTDKQMMQYGMHMVKECAPPRISGIGPVRMIDTTCHINGSVQHSHMVMTYTGDSNYHMDMQTEFNPPMYGQSKSHMTQDAKWSGACPAGWKPGDMMIGGMRMNVLKTMSSPTTVGGATHLTPEQIRAIIKAHQR
jgi:hypothetical protein